MINPIKHCLLFHMLLLSFNAISQSAGDNPFYVEFSIIESDLGKAEFNSNQFGPPGFGLQIGYQDFISDSNFFYDLNIQYSLLRIRISLGFVEPFGALRSDVRLNNLNFSGNLGYRFSRFTMSYGFGFYKNQKVNSKDISELDKVFSEVDDFRIASQSTNFRKIGMRLSIEIGYFLTDKTELKLNTAVSFVEGRNPFNANGLRYLSMIEYGIGIRRYLF